MAVSFNVVSLFNGSVTPTAPLIEGSAASSLSASGFDTTTSVTGRYGCRVTFPSALDCSTHDFVSFFLNSSQYGPGLNIDTTANGGWRVIFVDGSGNYAGFNLYGSDVQDYNASNTGIQDGFFTSFPNIDPVWHINRSATPAISSGSINWANITAVEFTAKTTISTRKQAAIQRVAKRSGISITGTETFQSIYSASQPANTGDNRLTSRSPYYQFGSANIVYAFRLGLTVGNGSTTTNLTQSSFSLAFENTFDKSPTYRSTGNWIQLDSNNTRKLYINQSASDVLSFSDFSIASAAWWQWELTGSGTASCSRGQFWRFNGFKAGHGTYTDCVWDSGEAAVEITAATNVVRGTVRNGVGHGIQITGAAGDYSDLDIDFSNNSTYDIELGSGGAGNYVLTGIGVVGSYTLKIRNNSATNAITVEIPSGIAYSTSTAGGTISVITAAVYQSVAISGLTSGSRIQIYDTTSSAELYNGVVAGTSHTWTDSVAAAADRAIRLRVSYVSGTSAKEFIEANIGTCGTLSTNADVSYLANQVNDAVYNANAINGSTVTGVTFTDAATDIVNIDVASNTITWPEIYAAFVYWIGTASGIADDIAYIQAKDTANYTLTSMKIKNTSSPSEPLVVSGGYGVDSVTNTSLPLVDTTGGTLIFAPDHVVAKVVTVSGANVITGDVADVLAAIPSASTNASAVRTELTTELSRIDAAVSSRATQASVSAIPTNPLLVSSYVAPDNAGIAGIKAKTDQLTINSGVVSADTVMMNGAAVVGTGTASDKWRGA